MEAQVDTLCLLAQPKEGQQQFKNKKQTELTENRTAGKSENQGNKEETFIQTGRRSGNGQPGRGGLRTWRWLVDPVRWQIVEWGRPGCSWQAPQGGGWQALQPHIHAEINQEERWGREADTQPRAPEWGNKASNL